MICADEVASFDEARRCPSVANDEGWESPVGAYDDATNVVDHCQIAMRTAEGNLIDIRKACGAAFRRPSVRPRG